MKCLIILNPYSGKQNNLKNIDIIKEKLLTLFEIVDVFISDKIGSITKKISALSNEYDLLFVLGGDGTLHEVVNALIKFKLNSKINLYYYPCGTLNDFASSYKLNVKLNDIAKIIKNNNIQKIDTIKVNEKYFIYASAFGKFSSISYEVNIRHKKVFQQFAYYFNIIKSLFKHYKLKYKLKIDDTELNINNYLTLFLNSTRVGGFNIHYKNKILFDDQKIKLVIIKKSFFSFFNFIFFFFFGEHFKNKNILFLDVDNLKIEANSLIKLNGDGELLLTSDRLTLSCSKDDYIKIYLPK